MQDVSDNLEEKFKNLPDQPGVYMMKSVDGIVIYVGKAISLKNRVRQYFQNSRNHSPKVRAMVEKVEDFDYIITDTELEALILECNLIKKHKPRYNILLKDDKHYPYVKINMAEDFPRVVTTRILKNDKARYFGPFIGMNAIQEVLDVLKKVFPLRTCTKNIKQGMPKERPCLNYHIHQCLGPCQQNISSIEYKLLVKQIITFLGGRYDEIIHELRENMKEAAEHLNYEKAAIFRDRIQAIERIAQKQKAISIAMEDQDVIALARDSQDAIIQMFLIRDGKLIGSEHFLLHDTEDADAKEILSSFLKQFYLTASYIPREILLQEEIEEITVVEQWLTGIKGTRIFIKVPQKGEKKKLMDMAQKNAWEALEKLCEKTQKEQQRTAGAVIQLSGYLGINQIIKRIEAFDISNIQGTDSVASMVVFENGKPKNNAYRRFKIKTVKGANDFASMAEVIRRRFIRGLEEQKERKQQNLGIEDGKFSSFPDLILIDGGKGQLHAALEVLYELDLQNIPAIGLAKQFEEIFMENSESPILLPKNSDALHLIQRIRDEAHRFAVTYHRSLRGNGSLHSVLQDIPNIGEQRRKALFRQFATMDEIKAASVDDLIKIKEMNRIAAKSVYDYFHK